MEKKKRKIAVALCGMLVVCASIGIGFAVEYFAQVDNSSNDVEPEYLLLAIDGNLNGIFGEEADYTSGFDGQIAYNSVTTYAGVTWSFPAWVDTETVDGNLCAGLGSVVIQVTPSAASKTFVLSMEKLAGSMDSSVTFYATATGCADPVQMNNGAFIFEDLTTTSTNPAEITITLYAYIDLSQYDAVNLPPVELLDGVTFRYTATATL